MTKLHCAAAWALEALKMFKPESYEEWMSECGGEGYIALQMLSDAMGETGDDELWEMPIPCPACGKEWQAHETQPKEER